VPSYTGSVRQQPIGDRSHIGTKVLLDNMPNPPAGGDFLDLGCGWGPISLTLATLSPHARIWAVDVNERALDLVRRNAAELGLENILAVRPEDVMATLEKLGDLKAKGILTQDEFEAKKAELLRKLV
jgi:16S rRNA G1207 methylase RsmC